MSDNLQDVWILGSRHTLFVLTIFQSVNLVLTFIHSRQELEGRLWRYLGAIAGVKIPDSFGRAVFFGGLTLSLWAVGLIGISGTVLWETPIAFGCLGGIIGCRLSDSLCSHIRWHFEGYHPNPGLESVPLYLIEAVALIVIFSPTIIAHSAPVIAGFIVGAIAFYSVVPGLKLLGPLMFQNVEPWKQRMPQPE